MVVGKESCRTALVVRFCTSNVEGMGSIPGLGNKIPHARGCIKKNERERVARIIQLVHEQEQNKESTKINLF